MYINTNTAALNSWLDLQNTQQSMNNVLEQLSSGYQINSAANNPAGLAISEQMQSQINGMSQAYQNAQSGISMLQTADGALGQVQNILQSMYSLATQSANDTNIGVDRGSLQSEMNQYTSEIDSIVNQTAFNNKNLLGGTLTSLNLAIGADPNQELQIGFSAADAVSLGVAGYNPNGATFAAASTATATSDGLTGLSLFTGSNTTNPYGSYGLGPTSTSGTPTGNYQIAMTAASLAKVNGDTIDGASSSDLATTSNTTGNSASLAVSDLTYTGSSTQSIEVQANYSAGTATATSVQYSTDGGSTWITATTNSSGDYVFGSTGLTAATVAFELGATATDTGSANYTLNLTPAQTTFQLQDSSGNNIGSATTVYGQASSSQNVTVGDANNGQAIQLTYNAGTFFSAATASGDITLPSNFNFNISYAANSTASGSDGTLSSKATVGGGLSIMNYTQASATQSALQSAMNQISAERANVGAWQNRLQFASSGLQTSQNNLTSAQAGIMDANVALDTANLAKDQVLQQSGVAMLAQAEQIPQALLKLLP